MTFDIQCPNESSLLLINHSSSIQRRTQWKDADLRKQMKWASTEAGLRGWPRLLQQGHEPDVQRGEDENEMEELMEQPEGTQEHGI
jgi:hypothetical protein